MFTAEIGIGVVVMIVFAAFWLAFMLWEDWGQAGKTARARASAKANAEHDHTQWCDYRLSLDDGRAVRGDAGGYHCIRQKCERVCDSVVRVHGVRGCLLNIRDLQCRKRRRGRSAVY